MRTLSFRQNQGKVCRFRSFGARRGFSLIELIVSLCVLFILVGIMMPGLHQALKVTAPRIQCSNNLYQIKNAIKLHLNDHNDEYPIASFYWPRRGEGRPPLHEVIGQYVDGEKTIWGCPADIQRTGSGRIYGSYVYPLAAKLHENQRIREGGNLNQRFPLVADRGPFHVGREYRRNRDDGTDEIYLIPAGRDGTQFEFHLRNGQNRLTVNGKVTTENRLIRRGSGN